MNITELALAADRLREKEPLVHCITNYVTATDTANILLSAGASPIMADDPAESAEITAAADALTINLGTISQSRIEAMIHSIAAANAKGIPVVLDPVGVNASRLRREAVERILNAGRVTIVRGNGSELSALAGLAYLSHGVDAAEGGISAEKIAGKAAERLGCICVMTGGVDVVTDGDRLARLYNGVPMLKKITGAGCMTSALTAAFAAVADHFSAAALGTAAMGIFGELAYHDGIGTGSLHTGLFDAAWGLCGKTLSEKLKYEEC
ncbi:MAG: hydroxyethylthiazole kinase [Oscillospiraceae bacterium]